MNLGMSTAESLEWSTAADKVITVYRASHKLLKWALRTDQVKAQNVNLLSEIILL